MNKMHFILRAAVVTARDMFTGLILGVCATVLMAAWNPNARNVAALFMPAGFMAGILKGLSKFVFLNLFSLLPSKGYRYNYPKFGLLLLWIMLLLASLVYAYGFRPSLWVADLFRLVRENMFIGGNRTGAWMAVAVCAAAAGLVSYFYEPPPNADEFLPAPAEKSDAAEDCE